MAAMRQAVTRVLDAHDPFPGIALDRHWNIVVANARGAAPRGGGAARAARAAAQHVRLGLHPRGIAAFTVNFDDWGRHLLHELQRLADDTIDAGAAALLDEVRGYPNVQALLRTPPQPAPAPQLLVPCVLELGGQRLSLFTTLATFGSPRDVTLAELTVELFYPADAATRAGAARRRLKRARAGAHSTLPILRTASVISCGVGVPVASGTRARRGTRSGCRRG